MPPFDGAGTFSPPGADFPAETLTVISSTKYNNVINDIATGLSNCLTRDGQGPSLDDFDVGNHKVTNLASGTARTDAATVGNVQDSTYLFGGTAGGTANALTLTLSPPITSYVAGQRFVFKASATNTGAATLAVSGIVGPKAIQFNSSALAGSEIENGRWYDVIYDGTAFQLLTLSSSPWTTGDVKAGYKTVADPGWVMMNDGTIGNASSGGTTRANADTLALFTLLWNNTADAQCAVSGGRGASAAADYAANKTLALPKSLGRALAFAGAGSGLTSRVLALATGAESKTIAAANLPASGLSVPGLSVPSLSVSVSGSDINLGFSSNDGSAGGARLTSGAGPATNTNGAVNTDNADMVGCSFTGSGSTGTGTTGGGTTGNMGSGTAFDVMNPMQFLNVMVKL